MQMLRHLPPNVRRMLKIAVRALVGAALVGATYQGVATALERRDLEPHVRLVDAGGHQLHIDCEGEGAPTVVLEAAAGAMSPSWAWVRAALADTTRVCAYDRARLGWSESAADGYQPGRVPDELHALLTNAREPGPYVIVGHELGASFARVYAARYPADVAALVLVEETRSGWGSAIVQAWPWLARLGLLRLTGSLADLADGLPAEAETTMRAFLHRPDHLTRAADEHGTAAAVTAEAARSALDASIQVTTVTTTSRGRPAILADKAQAAPIAAAVKEAVAHVRAGITGSADLRP